MSETPRVFISYSWDSDDHKAWAKTLADRLIANGVDVILDQYDCPPGTNFPYFMERSVEKSDKVLLILTENYKQKADGRVRGVGYEISIVSAEVYEQDVNERKFIPILRQGDSRSAKPIFMRGIATVDMRQDADFENNFNILLKTIFDHSDKPALGQRPDFTKSATSIAASTSFTMPERTDISHLPDLQPHFTAREQELALLDEAWADPQTNLLQFVAPGGTGKTMLLTYWLHHRLPESKAERPAAIYAWSFYRQGSDEQRQSSSDYFFAAAARFFEIELPKDPTERGRELARHLRRQRCLLLLDGTEPLQYPPGTPGGLGGKLKDPALAALLKELAYGQPGLCLLSTRVPIENLAGIEAPKHLCRRLENFEAHDGALLLKNLGVRGPQRELEAASKEYKGHALALRLLGNYLVKVLGADVRRRNEIPHLTDEKKDGYHARRVMQAYVHWFEAENAKPQKLGFWKKLMGKKQPPVSPEVALLKLMGLFDRPAPVEALDILVKKPAIAGLTDGLASLPAERLTEALDNLKTLGLLETNRLKNSALPKNLGHLSALRELESIDAHPLVREHLGQQLEAELHAAWREANTRLYHYYKNLPEKHQPDTLEELEPLYTAMAFGARAGWQQEVLEEVYWERINRKDKFYSTRQLGAFGTDLAGLAALFEQPWSQPSPNMSEAAQAWVLSVAGFGLRGLGRLREAAEPMRASLDMNIDKNWKEAAAIASNQSELHLTLGALREAVAFGRQAVDFADRSGDDFHKESKRTTLADALHQSGQSAEAEQLFAEAEAMQRESQPQHRFLYSVWGYRYCDLLLGQGKWEEVLERANTTLQWAREGNLSLLTIALDHLSIARAYAAHAQSIADPAHRDAAEQHFNRAVEGLRKAGTTDMLPQGLLARAHWRLQTRRPAPALEDLEEVYEIAESGSMGLYLVDWHIAMSRLRRMEGDDAAAAKHKTEALKRVRETGYLRRLEEAEGL
ncbi:MAG TPA: TIR domain-containing protein [Saprospiraceae bacterium]|nr:TIR domain-containing protein [Saprospiraceae bacterium]